MKVMNESPARALLSHRRNLARRLAARFGSAEAEDLASEALARGLARPSPDGRQAPWIETIFRNLVRDERRREGRRGQPVALREDLAATTATPEEAVLAAERTRALSAAMPAIPGELREAVVARFFDDQDYADLAVRCGISPATARTRVHRGLARLRVVLGRAWAWLPIWPRGLIGMGTHAAATALVPAAVVAVAVFGTAPSGWPRGGAVVAEDTTSARVAPVRRSKGSSDAPWIAPPRSSDDEGAPVAAGPSGEAEGTRYRRARPAGPTVARPPAAAPANRDPSARADRVSNAAAADDAAPAAVRRLAFDEDEVTGDLQRPGTAVVTGDPGRETFDSLIEIPASFEPSLTKMIEDM